MEFRLYCFALVFLTITTACTDALDCYTCTNASYVSECKSTTTCNAEEICFSDHIQTPHGMLYSFGCRAEAKCSLIIQDGNSAGSGSIVGRSASTGTCSECCKNQHCNRQLCQHSFSDKECSDGTEMNCKSVGSLVNICTDTQHAKTVCERFCGLCSYADGSWSTWLTWSSCDVTCGNGTQTRIRKCTEPSPSGGGHDCAGMSQEAQTCTEESCPVHGAWAAWNPWGSCSATCGIGLQRRDRSCSAPYPGPNGNHCFGDSRDDQICLANICHVTNGGWGSWTSWTSCSASCNGGMQSRQRHCNNPKPSADGEFCDGSPMDVRMCNQQHCPRTKAAFLAGFATKLSSGRVQFSNVHLNEGSVYNSSTGMFTCNIPGVYSFTASISESGYGNNYLYCHIRKNGYDSVTMYHKQGKIGDTYATEGYGAATGAATLHLAKGDHVDVSCSSLTGTRLSYSSFTGFLISVDP